MRRGNWSDSADWYSSCLLPPASCLLPPASCSLAPAPCSLRALSPRAIAPPPPPPHHRTSPGEDPGPIAPRHSSGAIHGPGSSPGKCGGWERYHANRVSRLPHPTKARRLENEIKPASLPPPCGEGTGVGMATRANAHGFIPEATSAPAPPPRTERRSIQLPDHEAHKGAVGTAHPGGLGTPEPPAPKTKNGRGLPRGRFNS